MKINIDIQAICTPPPGLRGIPFYMINLTKTLARRPRFSYSISFFDYGRQRNNRRYIEEYIGETALSKLEIRECNTLSYKTIIESNRMGTPENYDGISYGEYTGSDADVFFFPHSIWLAQNVRRPTVVTVHDLLPMIPEFQCTMRQPLIDEYMSSMRFIADHEDILLAVDSESTKNDAVSIAGISADRIFVVPLGYDTSVHFPEKNEAVLREMGITAPYLLYVGALDPRKGIGTMLDAFEMLKPRHRDLQLVLAGQLGETDDQPISSRLSKALYPDDVILPGFITDDQKRALLSSAKVFLFPSEYEGFGLPVLEAMACGAPVVTTDVSSLPEVGGGAVVYVPPKNAGRLAAETERFLMSEELSEQYRRLGFRRVTEFSWDRTAKMTEEIFQIAYERGKSR